MDGTAEVRYVRSVLLKHCDRHHLSHAWPTVPLESFYFHLLFLLLYIGTGLGIRSLIRFVRTTDASQVPVPSWLRNPTVYSNSNSNSFPISADRAREQTIQHLICSEPQTYICCCCAALRAHAHAHATTYADQNHLTDIRCRTCVCVVGTVLYCTEFACADNASIPRPGSVTEGDNLLSLACPTNEIMARGVGFERR